MKGKGFVMTMDAMVAMMLAGAFIVAILYFVTMPQQLSEEYLYSFGGDFLTVADKDGSMLAALSGNRTPINDFLKTMPRNVCFNLTLYDRTGGALFSNATGCQEPARYVIIKRTIVNATDEYPARLRVWYAGAGRGTAQTTTT
jgi:hypothetical protein